MKTQNQPNANLPWHVEPGALHSFAHPAIFAADGQTKIADALHEPEAAFIVRACNRNPAHEAIATEAQNLVEFIENALRDTIHHDDAEYYALKMRALLSTLKP